MYRCFCEGKKQQVLQGETRLSPTTPYRSDQAKGKAVKSVVSSLPALPHQ